MNKIKNSNYIHDLENLLIAVTSIDNTNLVYEIITVDKYSHVAIRHSNDDYHANTYYQLTDSDMALDDIQFQKMLLKTFIKTEILDISCSAEDIADMLDTLIN